MTLITLFSFFTIPFSLTSNLLVSETVFWVYRIVCGMVFTPHIKYHLGSGLIFWLLYLFPTYVKSCSYLPQTDKGILFKWLNAFSDLRAVLTVFTKVSCIWSWMYNFCILRWAMHLSSWLWLAYLCYCPRCSLHTCVCGSNRSFYSLLSIYLFQFHVMFAFYVLISLVVSYFHLY